MLAVNYTSTRENFKHFCDKANDDVETIVITRKSGGNVVLLSEAAYNNLMENLFVRSNKADYALLLQSMDQLKIGQASSRKLVETE